MVTLTGTIFKQQSNVLHMLKLQAIKKSLLTQIDNCTAGWLSNTRIRISRVTLK